MPGQFHSRATCWKRRWWGWAKGSWWHETGCHRNSPALPHASLPATIGRLGCPPSPMRGRVFPSCKTFSCRLIRDTKSCALTSLLREVHRTPWSGGYRPFGSCRDYKGSPHCLVEKNMAAGWAAGYKEPCQLASNLHEHYEYVHLNLLQDHPPSTKIGIRIAKYPQQILSLNLIKKTLHIIIRTNIIQTTRTIQRLKYLHRKSLWNCVESALVTVAGMMLTWSAEAHAWHRISSLEVCPWTTEYIQAALKFVSGGWQYIMPLGSDQKRYCD